MKRKFSIINGPLIGTVRKIHRRRRVFLTNITSWNTQI